MDEAKLKEAVKVLKEVQTNLGGALQSLEATKTASVPEGFRPDVRVAEEFVTMASCLLGEVLHSWNHRVGPATIARDQTVPGLGGRIKTRVRPGQPARRERGHA